MKGSVSLDALVALVLAFMIFAWIQSYARLELENANSFGANLNMKAQAIGIGSRMNAFYAWMPGPNDYTIISEQLVLLNSTQDVVVSKLSTQNFTSTSSVDPKGIVYSSTYSVPTGIWIQALTNKVMRT